jgi:hypothetical protein
MKRILLILPFFLLFKLSAQETPSLGWDIDNVFDRQSADMPEEKQNEETTQTTVLQMINRRSLTFDASYNFALGLTPGWENPPWYGSADGNFKWNPVVKFNITFALDAQISQVFRVLTALNFQIPNIESNDGFRFLLGDFFFDYNLFDTVFIRGGKYSLKWGISPNFSFTNLLSRIPDSKNFSNDSFILKVDIPVGVGGFQLLALTRTDIFDRKNFSEEKLGYGGKYNLALREFDMDTGIFYQQGMPLRYFVSIKTTFGNTEVYSEGLIAFDNFNSLNISGAFNIGFVQEFLQNRLTVNGEFFFNNEAKSFYYNPETEFIEARASPFLDGFSMAINLRYGFGGRWNPRFYLQVLYEGFKNSAQVVPALRLSPISNVGVYIGVPMALGNENGYYSKEENTIMRDRYGKPIRFAFVLFVSLSGGIRYTVYP